MPHGRNYTEVRALSNPLESNFEAANPGAAKQSSRAFFTSYILWSPGMGPQLVILTRTFKAPLQTNCKTGAHASYISPLTSYMRACRKSHGLFRKTQVGALVIVVWTTVLIALYALRPSEASGASGGRELLLKSLAVGSLVIIIVLVGATFSSRLDIICVLFWQ